MVDGRAEAAVAAFRKLRDADPNNADYAEGLDLAEGFLKKQRGEGDDIGERMRRASQAPEPA